MSHHTTTNSRQTRLETLVLREFQAHVLRLGTGIKLSVSVALRHDLPPDPMHPQHTPVEPDTSQKPLHSTCMGYEIML